MCVVYLRYAIKVVIHGVFVTYILYVVCAMHVAYVLRVGYVHKHDWMLKNML